MDRNNIEQQSSDSPEVLESVLFITQLPMAILQLFLVTAVLLMA